MHSAEDKLSFFLISQAIIWIPLFLGHWLRRKGRVRPELAKPIHLVNLSLIAPFVYGLGLWRLDRSTPEWYWVPVIMAILLTVSTVAGAWLSFRFVRNHDSAATLALMIPLSNTGHTLAGFITLLLFSDAGYSYNSLLMWPMILFNYLVWLPQARHWGHGRGQSFLHSFGKTILSSQSLIMVGLVAGTWLNFKGLPMSPFWIKMLKIMVYVGTVSTMFALGCRLRLGRTFGYQKTLRWVYLAKFLVHPLIVIVLCLAFGVHGLAAGALFIAGCASTGVNVVAFATLFDLDVDLANAGYLWSTAIFMLLILPLIILAIHAPLFQP